MNEIFANIPEIISNFETYSETFLQTLGIWGALVGSLLIVVESILPFMPLCVFITFNFLTFGNVVGFLISWICTCIGCYLSFILFRSKIKDWLERKIVNKKAKKLIDKFKMFIDDISVSGLAVLVAIPFTPAFVVNIAAGLSDISKKKFLTGIIIGKLFMVYFWGYVGTTLMECLADPKQLIKIIVMMICAFIISKVVNKYFKLD